MRIRFPAEWEPQAGIMLAWPDERTDWASRLAEAQREYTRLVAAVTRFEPTLVVVRDSDAAAKCRSRLVDGGARPDRLLFALAPYDDTWVRDFGPLSIETDGGPGLVNFRFDGWGGKFTARRDDNVTRVLHQQGCFGGINLVREERVVEGGAIESDGSGTILTTEKCWRARHPDLGREGAEALLEVHLGARRVLWLGHGGLTGDDTDSHVDTLARFCDRRTIAFQRCDDPADPDHEELDAMARQLEILRSADGDAYRLVPLPWPGAVHTEGRRLPAGYANFLILNGAVLVPALGVEADERAVATLGEVFTDREVIAVPARTLIWQNGGLHCATMQIGRGIPLTGTP